MNEDRQDGGRPSRQELEQEMAEALEHGEMRRDDPEGEARRRLPNKTEIRVTAETDPVAAETRKYRTLAKEVDDRYDRPRSARRPHTPG